MFFNSIQEINKLRHGLVNTGPSQQTFVGLREVLKTSLTRLQRNNFSSSKTSWERLEDVLQIRLEDVLKASWRHLARRPEDVLKDKKLLCLRTSWTDVLQTLWRHALKTSWRHVLKTCLEDMFWRHVLKTCLEDVLRTSWRQTKCLLGISVSNHGLLTNLINQYLTNLYLTNLYFTHLRRIQNALIRTQ